MKHVKWMMSVAIAVCGLMASDAMAAKSTTTPPVGPRPNGDRIDCPFIGIVTSVSTTGLTVKGEAHAQRPPGPGAPAPAQNKPEHQSVHFSIKAGAKITCGGKPCELKDIKKGYKASVTFTTKADSSKLTVTEIECSEASDSPAEKPKPGEKK